ncbi:MAG TPA: hypothetical protein PKN75_08605 [Bacteroidia bacterium]|nr:hypothetical protein [Bacteroidia bacterium]HNU33639.1 hypothetical protein [Bacteroidia bacterium]
MKIKTKQTEMFKVDQVFYFTRGQTFDEHSKEVMKLVKKGALKRYTTNQFAKFSIGFVKFLVEKRKKEKASKQ